MKSFIAAGFLLIFVSFSYAAISTDEIIKLSKLKTSDEVILQLIQKEGLSKPISSQDVVYLKEQGVSDRVIRYMLKVSQPASGNSLPAQEGKSTKLDNNMRSYYTTGKNGKKVLVVTNVDENGKRMGGEAPPDLEPAPQQAQQKQTPQEVRVVVENPQPSTDYYERGNEYPEPEYVDDRYNPPSYYPPAYSYYGSGGYYSPYYYDYPYQHNRNYHQMDSYYPRNDGGKVQPIQRPTPQHGPVQHGASGGTRRASQPTRR